jgi:hypothetical protein
MTGPMPTTSLVVPHFEPVEHLYTVDNRVIPSVTQVLEDVGIVDYSHIPPSVRDEALYRGSYVHQAIALWLEDDLDEKSVNPKYVGYFKAAKRFTSEWELTPNPGRVEYRGYHENPEYCGGLDVEGLVTMPALGRRDVLIDWKTGSAQAWVRLQTALYASFFAHPATRYRICVELHADETYRVYIFPPQTFAYDQQRAFAAVMTYYTKRGVEW